MKYPYTKTMILDLQTRVHGSPDKDTLLTGHCYSIVFIPTHALVHGTIRQIIEQVNE